MAEARDGGGRIVTFFSIFDWVEHTGLSLWVREDPFLVGTNVAVDARVIGAARGVPLESMRPFFRVMWIGFWVNAVSGTALLIAYPTKALTNPVFYLKLTLIAACLVQARWILRHIPPEAGAGDGWTARAMKVRASLSLMCWLSAVTAGRLLAYTYHHLMAHEGP